MKNYVSKEILYSGLVWVLSGLALTIYGVMGLFNKNIPGVEELVAFLSSADGIYIYVAAFISIFLEGLYFIGSFFPGATLVLVLAILSQVGGVLVFLGTILTIFIGWCIAGVVNVTLAKTYHLKTVGTKYNLDYQVRDRIWVTWFPAFRANYEVAQVTEGGNPHKVFLSALRVRFWAVVFMALSALVIPLFINIHEVSNQEGFISVAVVSVISFVVGGVKLHAYWTKLNRE